MSDNMLDKDFKELIAQVKQDILATRYRAMEQANSELIMLYYRLGKIISDNTKYGNKFIENFSAFLKLEFPNNDGFSKRNLSRMKAFYEEYKDSSILPMSLAKLPWAHNYLLIEKIKDKNIREWYAEKCYQNGWSYTVLDHQIDSDVYARQAVADKLTNFDNKLSLPQSELARDVIKDPYIFELEGIKDEYVERDVENAMLEKIKNVLLEFGKGFSFVGNQYRVSTKEHDYYIDMLFYHLELRSYIAVELKVTEFKPEYIGQLGFYVTAVDETLRKEQDNPTIGLLLCKGKDKLSVEWALKSTNAPIGVSSYEIAKILPKEVLAMLPTEEDINLHIDINSNLN
ncbi:MAG: PDDEXK nuclease domain-containing protein [Lachnospiraceae bacterium]|jgi:predicted nuclease of restriction endonuclease-like (RecB) superfamily|nr:PDDEXK nuclease domain-containing protein [Lachnospiraceae bacterium]